MPNLKVIQNQKLLYVLDKSEDSLRVEEYDFVAFPGF